MRWLSDLRTHAGTLAERFAARRAAPRSFGEPPTPDQLFPVQLKLTGGVGFPCSYVYSAFDLGADINDANQAIAMNLTPYFGGVRSAFAMSPAADGSVGLASFVAGALVLWFARETINSTVPC